MTDRYGEAVYAAVESDGLATTARVYSDLKISYNEAAKYTERMVADGIISEPDVVGRRRLLKNFMGCCEPCGAPLFEDDEYGVDENGCAACIPAFHDGPVIPARPCYAFRVSGLSAASADTRPEGGDAQQAPFTSGAVPEGQTPNPSSQSHTERKRA